MRFIAGILLFVCLASGVLAQQQVHLRSGNGQVNGNDARVSFLLGPADAPFPRAFTAADFTAARTGSRALINNRQWVLPSDPLAQSITTQPAADHTALYAISFEVQGAVVGASLSFEYIVDNLIGGSPNQGIFLNGMPISGNTMGLPGLNGPSTITRNDIGPLLVTGTNTLYVYARV
jgi:hypothetical protein